MYIFVNDTTLHVADSVHQQWVHLDAKQRNRAIGLSAVAVKLLAAIQEPFAAD